MDGISATFHFQPGRGKWTVSSAAPGKQIPNDMKNPLLRPGSPGPSVLHYGVPSSPWPPPCDGVYGYVISARPILYQSREPVLGFVMWPYDITIS